MSTRSQAEALQAGLERAHHPVPRIVVGDFQRRRVDIDAFRRLARATRLKQSADLGRKDHRRLAAQSRADPLFGEAETVERGGVEITHAKGRGVAHGGAGVRVAERRVHVSERRCPQAKGREVEALAAARDQGPDRSRARHQRTVGQARRAVNAPQWPIGPAGARSWLVDDPRGASARMRTETTRMHAAQRDAEITRLLNSPGLHLVQAAVSTGWRRRRPPFAATLSDWTPRA